MPIVIPVEVQVPPTYNANVTYLQDCVNRYAQALVDLDVANQRPHRTMTMAEVEARSISLEESKRRVTELIHNFYQKKES